MKIVFKKSVLTDALTYALCAVSTKNTLISIQGVLIESIEDNKCKISSFDLEKGMQIIIDAEVIEAGSCIINAQRLNQIAKILPESDVTLSLNGDIACLSSGKSEFELSSQKAEEFPSIPDINTSIAFSLKQTELHAMVAQTIFAVSLTNQRPVFTGALFKIEQNNITVVGCDGYRLAVKEVVCEEGIFGDFSNIKFIIPGKTLSELMKIIGDSDDYVNIKVSEKHVVFEIANKNLVFFSRLLEGEYIDYERLLPKSFNTFVYADSDILVSALERASLVSEENTATGSKSFVRLNLNESKIEISSVSAKGKVKDEVSVEKEGQNLEIGFSCRYLLDSIKACRSEKIKISLVSPLISVLIEPEEAKENEKLIMLVLPIKLK